MKEDQEKIGKHSLRRKEQDIGLKRHKNKNEMKQKAMVIKTERA